ncbi:MAG TPA: VWA domain-containing protein [Thermoanaerobaculia bacterium]|nr:VWA domain-containing protein [Thermoanaerobaculia bacterium]
MSEPLPALSARGPVAAVLALALAGVASAGAQPDQDGVASPASPLQSFAISQVTQLASEPPAVEVHLALVDRDGSVLGALAAPPEVHATIGEERALVTPLVPFAETGEGVGYVVLVDVSASLSREVFARLQDALSSWIRTFFPADRVALISFGDASRVRSDFTGDLEEVVSAVGDLAPTDRSTLLHRALIDALDLAVRADPDLPTRRAIVVLTDGRDEGSGLTVEDVLERLQSSPFPVYAVGFSNLSGSDRQRHLDVLLRLATASGGAFYEARGADLADAYRRIGRQIREVWVTRLLCPQCRADGGDRHLEIVLESGSRVHSRGGPIRLLPGRGTPDRSRWQGAAISEQPERPETAAPERAGAGREEADRGLPPVVVALAVLGVLAAIGGVLLVRSRRARRRADPHLPPMTAAPPPAAAAAGAQRTAPAAPPPTRAAPSMAATPRGEPRLMQLAVVRGATRGAEHRLVLRDTARVGRRSTCDLVLAEEPGLAPEQFALVHSGHLIFLQDLSEDGSTLVNGRTPVPPQPVEPGDLIGNRNVILRIRFDT